jgi:hypothetical protein
MLLSFRDLNPVAFGVLHIVILFPGVPIYAFPCVVGDVVFAYFSPRDVAGRILTDGGSRLPSESKYATDMVHSLESGLQKRDMAALP